MTEKPPVWADLLLTIWIAVVGVIYFGAYFVPEAIGPWTGPASRFYALMLLVAAAVCALRLLARPPSSGADAARSAAADPVGAGAEAAPDLAEPDPLGGSHSCLPK
jgi:hypothetical protein